MVTSSFSETSLSGPIVIYTDGACRGNPGRGGWGAILSYKDKFKELSGFELNTTNNRMELLAVIEALRAVKKPYPIEIYTDSRYVQKGVTEWLEAWKARGWKTASKKAVKNQDLWEELDKELQHRHVSFRWVKGHAGNAGNERADSLANAAIDAHMDSCK